MRNNSIPPDMEGKSVGAILKEARESGGQTLDDAVRVTRIGKPYLLALEEGRYDRLPNDAYIKGFLRVYAAYLKLPEDEIVLAYEKYLSDKNPSPGNAEPQAGKNQIPEKSSGIPAKRIYPVFIFVALIAVSAYLITVQSGKKQDGRVSKSSNGRNSATVPGNVGIPVVSTPPAQEPDKANENGTTTDTGVFDSTSSLPKGAILKIKVIADGWLDVTIDDAVTQHYELKSGDLIEWKAERGFALDIGNAGGVEVELDGKKLKPFGKTGEFAHVVLKAGGAKN